MNKIIIGIVILIISITIVGLSYIVVPTEQDSNSNIEKSEEPKTIFDKMKNFFTNTKNKDTIENDDNYSQKPKWKGFTNEGTDFNVE